jgi:hypothetical protein
MITAKKGSMTIFLALTVLTFFSFGLVLVEGTRIYFLRVQAMQAMELAEFSVLSEYQQETFEKYHLFFLDLDYEQGEESVGILEQRAKSYLEKNATQLQTKDLTAEKFCRATDGGGSVFFEQVTEWMKLKKGYVIFEELFAGLEDIQMEEINLEEILKEHKKETDGMISKENVSDSENFRKIVLPDVSFPSVRRLTESVLGDIDDLSQKSIDLSERISKRILIDGVGQKARFSMTDMQLFHTYIFENCNYYGAKQSNAWNERLSYQVEYIVSGKASDRKNLENIIWKIFLLRAGGNYLFYHQDAAIQAKAQADAVALVGFLGNAALVELVKEIFLISQAIEEGIHQTKQIFAGEKVLLYQNGILSGLEVGYQEYLYLFLNSMNTTEKIYRTMDVLELEIRNQSGYNHFRWDHCVDRLELQWSYQFPRLFTGNSVFHGGNYENTIVRKLYYEK